MDSQDFGDFNLEKSMDIRLDSLKYWNDLENNTENCINLIENKGIYSDFNFDIKKISSKKINIFFEKSDIKNFYYDTYKDIGIINNLKFTDCKIINNNMLSDFKGILNKLELYYLESSYCNDFLYIKNFNINTVVIHNDSNNINPIGYEGIYLRNNISLKIFTIDNINIKELVLENINNNFESFEIRNCIIDKLIIKNSNLGKAVFNGVTIKELELQNTTLNDCLFNGVDFSANYELTEITNGNIVDYKVMKDNYRQLKHVMDKNANYTLANKFFALEMEELRKYYKKNNKSPINEIKKLDLLSNNISTFGDYLLLSINKITNNYGTNWILNLFWLIVLSTVFSIGKFYYMDVESSGKTVLDSITELSFLHQENITLFGNIGYGVTFLGYFLSFLIFGGILFFGYKNILLGILLYILLLGFVINPEIFKNFINLLLNPTYGFNIIPNIHDNLALLGLLIYKIIYGTLIYQLIIALKRTTKR